MIGLIQRVSQASVAVDDVIIGSINQGLVLFLGVSQTDDHASMTKLANKVLGYRVFKDQNDKMNLSLRQIQGQLLVVSQFTLVADTQKGLRPSFSQGASPEHAKSLYLDFIEYCQQQDIMTRSGEFAANMQISLINDGPVTFSLQS